MPSVEVRRLTNHKWVNPRRSMRIYKQDTIPNNTTIYSSRIYMVLVLSQTNCDCMPPRPHIIQCNTNVSFFHVFYIFFFFFVYKENENLQNKKKTFHFVFSYNLELIVIICMVICQYRKHCLLIYREYIELIQCVI